jgi:hypothetical protein
MSHTGMIRRLGLNPLQQGALTQVGTFLIALLVAFVSILVFARSKSAVAPTFALLSLFAAASIVAGGTVGFLFALPRSVSVSLPATETERAQQLESIRIRPNTNLEDVSDWLTKIIIGLTLTQLGRIPEAASDLFVTLGTALGGTQQDVAFVGALTVFCSIIGFLMGWMTTRMYIGRWMAASDRPSEALNEALKRRAQESRRDPPRGEA